MIPLLTARKYEGSVNIFVELEKQSTPMCRICRQSEISRIKIDLVYGVPVRILNEILPKYTRIPGSTIDGTPNVSSHYLSEPGILNLDDSVHFSGNRLYLGGVLVFVVDQSGIVINQGLINPRGMVFVKAYRAPSIYLEEGTVVWGS